MPSLKPLAVAVSGLFVLTPALATDVVQKVRPPVSQAYIDLATFNGGMPMAQGGASGMLGGLFGGGAAKSRQGGNTFGQTKGQAQGRWMDVTLTTRNNPNLKTATQTVPSGSKLAPSLNLVVPETVKQGPAALDGSSEGGKPDTPKGKMYLYWGCGTGVRKGQPLVLDLAKMDPAQYGKFFQNRSATVHLPGPAQGRPGWPNKTDDRLVPEGASMTGEHAFAGEGVVDGFRFQIDQSHDLMPVVEASRVDEGKAVLFKWKPMQQAQAWFVQSMGMRESEGGDMEAVYWTSSELPDMGMGLLDYQPDGAVEKWRKEKVLLAAGTTECAAPKEAVSEMAMSRVIAYGDELNLAYPARPKDPKVTWEPQWEVKVRRKSVASLMPGMASMAMDAAGSQADSAANPAEQTVKQPPQSKAADGAADSAVEAVKKGAFDLFKNVLQRKAEEALSK